ncbi:hypothetical protein L7F22_045118 [Adiantum nelumboides]|nr:hypothetical protein [Adiantum nelumboides]
MCRRNMLGQRSTLRRTTSSRSLLIPCDDSDADTTTFCNATQVAAPALCSPCKIVVGFEVETEKKPPRDVCESPRSVLESSSVLSSHDKHQVGARSPRSGLGSLLAAKCGSEESVVSVAPDKCQHHEQGIISSPFKATAWLPKSFDHDRMDADMCACQGLVLHPHLQANMDDDDELLDADISPLRTTGFYMRPKEEMESNYKATTPKPLSFLPGSTVKVCEVAADTSTKQKKIHVNPSNEMEIPPFTAQYVNVHQKEPTFNWIHAPLPSMHSCKGELCVCSQFWHHLGMDVERDHHQSIFSASSPPCSRSLARASSGFLNMCNFCGRTLCLGKDIFMYRGDQPFCSEECRYQKIVLDEGTGKRGG